MGQFSATRPFSFDWLESGFRDGYNRWKYQVTETLPGGEQNVVYSNHAGMPMLTLFNSGGQSWRQFWKYDEFPQSHYVRWSTNQYTDCCLLASSRTYHTIPETGEGESGTNYDQTDFGYDTWYDAADNVIKQLPAGSKLFTKTSHDGLGRQIKQSQGYDLDESSYADASSISDDTLIEQSIPTYDAASNVIRTEHRQRYHNATGTGDLNGPAGVQPKSRITYSATWPDALGRTQATANYGTNGGSSLSRPSTIPSRSDTVLVTSLTYDAAGNTVGQTNPGGVTTCFTFDAAGRQTEMIQNCVHGSSSNGSSTSGGCAVSDDENVTVRTAYNADGNVSSITAVNSTTGEQVTEYVYGTTLEDSDIASSLLKRKEIYPDSEDEDDVIAFQYNRQGEVTRVRDQNGTVHAFDFDLLGRPTQDRVTTLGTGVDGAVRRIATSYEVRGMREKITSWNGETVGTGSVVNEVLFSYNEFGQLIADRQAHDGEVNPSTTPKVQYGYADGSSNTIRPETLTYPNGRALTYSYGAADSMPDALSRVAGIVDDDLGSTHLADYAYLGLGTFVEVDYTEPEIRYTLVGTAGGNDPDTGDIYRGLDRFGRVKDCYWRNDGDSSDVDRIKYGYDRNGNRIWRENVVAATYDAYFDEFYTYDRIDRLKSMERGRLNGSRTGVTNKTFAQCWSLDATGNWRKFLEDSDGDGDWSLDQTRTANTVNEITDLVESIGPSWVVPVYNRAGNMTTIPKPADPTDSFAATYDAWNRLVRLEDGTGTVAQYAYDGAKRRTIKKAYVDDVLDETRHMFYTEPSQWQVVEERVGTSTAAERQFVWGLRYVDDIVERDRDTDDDGSLDERLYGVQDAQWGTASVFDAAGNVVTRYAYTPYGYSTTLDTAFVVATNHAKWEPRYCGYYLDGESTGYAIRYRAYYPDVGFSRRDPVILRAYAANAYIYVNARPIVMSDPTGLQGAGTLIGCDTDRATCGSNCLVYLADTTVNDQDYHECIAKCNSDLVNCQASVICSGCIACCPNCKSVIQSLIDQANQHWAWNFPSNCQWWVFKFQPKTPPVGGCFTKVGKIYKYPIGTGREYNLRHVIIEITMCDGTKFYLDNGWWGDADHFVRPDELGTMCRLEGDMQIGW